MNQIPSVSLNGLNLESPAEMKEVGQLLIDAFSQIGVVRIEGTGLGLKDAIVKKTFQVYKQLFENSEEKKQKYRLNLNFHGYLVSKESLLTSPLKPDHLEQHFNIRGAACTSEDHSQYSWPDDLSSNFSATVKEFMGKCQTLSLVLLEALALGLSLDKSFFTKVHLSMHGADSTTTLGCMHCTCGHGADHKDLWHERRTVFPTFALIFQDELDGMQFCNFEDGRFINAHQGQDNVYVVVGDVLSMWTNNMFKVAEFRKVVTCNHHGETPSRQTLFYYAACDNNAVACDLKLESGRPQEIATATDEEQLTAVKVVSMKMAEAMKMAKNLN